ncbi:MAG TPA: NAD(P)/FAD-dependent oxidoreductase [Blastocatellia bacterium]|nr:NAD(P)/FAD-dependent oxidoreductase [Blastocatellia bacterium]
MRTYDFVAIGGGNAGMTAAARVAAAGRRTALIDRGAIGGLCSLNGCNPKKVLVRSTELLEEIRHASRFGIDVAAPRVDWPRVIDRKESFTNPVTASAEASLKEQGVDLIEGSPRFASRNALEVNGERVEAGAVLIATGSAPRPLDFEGADLVKTSDDILALRSVPDDLIIIGAGVVAMEFGQVFARLGARVKVVTPGKQVLSGEDEDMTAALMEFSARLGIEFIFQARVKSVRRRGESLMLEFDADGQSHSARADFVLNAAGRVASVGELALDKAEVETNRRGVVVNDYLRSPSNPGIFAAGDAHGRMQLSPIASYEGRVASRNFLEGDVERVNYDAIPRAVYTVPPLASVGLTEAEARKRGLDVEVVNSNMEGWKVYAIIEGGAVARAKIIIEKSSGRGIGAHIYGGAAGENINLFALAMRFDIKADDLKSMVYAYPTLASALPYALG